jgi:putative membrane protein
MLAGAASFVLAGPASAQPGPALPTADFIKAAAQTDEFERQEGRIAETRASDPRVRAFGRTMVRDHTKTTAALKAAIRKAGMKVPPLPPLSDEETRNIAALNGLKGAAFDRAYIGQQVQTHQTALGVMQGYAAGGQNPVLRQAAADTVPIVQHHLAMAKTLPGGS